MTAQDPTAVGVAIKAIAGYPGCFVGSDGSVWSCEFTDRTDAFRWRSRKLGTTPAGYKVVGLRRAGRTRIALVHRLVLEAFVGPCPSGHEGCHNNGIRDDNRLENLRWDTRKANAADRVVHGTHMAGAAKCVRGKLKLYAEHILAIRELRAAGHTQKSLSDQFGVSIASINAIVNRKTWKHI